MPKYISPYVRNLIIDKFRNGESARKIAEIFNIGKSTVYNIVNRYKFAINFCGILFTIYVS